MFVLGGFDEVCGNKRNVNFMRELFLDKFFGAPPCAVSFRVIYLVLNERTTLKFALDGI